MSDPRKQWLLDRFLAPVTFGTGPVDRVHRFFARDVWRVPTETLPLLKRALFRGARVLFLTVRGFLGDGCVPRARALTYITALSIIPVLALAFSVLKGFGLYGDLLENTINPFLDDSLGRLVPAEGDPNQLRVAVNEILQRVENTDFAGLGTIGLVVVMWAAMRLLGSVEGAFNDIWGVQKARSLIRRVTDYLAIVIAVPIFLVAAIGVTTMKGSEDVRLFLVNDLHLGPVLEFGLLMVPKLGGWLMFSFVYLVLPNTRTRVSSALLGGFFANILWQLTLIGLVRFQIGVANYNEFYAGFAAIPALLVWIQVSWVIVLLGAEVAFAHEHEPAYRGMASFRVLGHGAREVLALRAILRIAEAFMGDGHRLTVAGVAAELGVPPREVEGVLRALERADLVVAAEDREGGAAFVLGRDPESITLKHVTDALRVAAEEDEEVQARTSGDGTLDRLLAKLDEEAAGSAYNIDLRELVRRTRRDARAEPSGVEEPGVQLS